MCLEPICLNFSTCQVLCREAGSRAEAPGMMSPEPEVLRQPREWDTVMQATGIQQSTWNCTNMHMQWTAILPDSHSVQHQSSMRSWRQKKMHCSAITRYQSILTCQVNTLLKCLQCITWTGKSGISCSQEHPGLTNTSILCITEL